MDNENQLEDGLQEIKNHVFAFQERQEKKLNHLWVALQGKKGEEMKDEYLNTFLKKGLDTKALSSQDSTGTYLLSTPVQEKVFKRLKSEGSIRSLARVTSISSDALEVLTDKKESEVGWVSEVSEREETSAPELVRHKIQVHEMYAKPKISQKLLDDSAIDLEQWLIDCMSEQMSRIENISFVQGDGEGKPKGFLSYPKVAVGEGTFGKIECLKTGKKGGFNDIDVLYNALDAMDSYYLEGSVWYISRSALGALRRLKTSEGMPLWQPALQLNTPSTLLGYPVVVSDDMPSLMQEKESISMVLANFKKGYQIVDRHDIRMLRDPYSAKPYVEFYATKRVGGDVIDTKAFKFIDFSEV